MNGEVVHLQHSDIEFPLKITITFFFSFNNYFYHYEVSQLCKTQKMFTIYNHECGVFLNK